MNPEDPPALNVNDEIAALVATLHETGRRLEQLTAGEVDSVTDRDGRIFVLQSAQEQLRISDAAERNRAETMLRTSEQRLDLALESSQLGAWDLDLIHDTAWRTLQHDRIFGYESLLPEWSQALFLQHHILPEDRDQVRRYFEEALRTDRLFFECQIIRPDQSRRWIFVHGRVYRDKNARPVRMIGTVMDITERKQADADLLRLAAIVEYSDDAIIGKDLNDIITSWNRGAERIFGYRAHEMIGNSILQLIPVNLQDEERKILEKIKHGESSQQFETQRQNKDGRLIDVSVTASPIRDANGKVIGVSKTVRDITTRKIADEIVQKRTAELVLFNRLSVGRELQMIELKKQINEQAKQAGQKPPYELAFLSPPAATTNPAHEQTD